MKYLHLLMYAASRPWALHPDKRAALAPGAVASSAKAAKKPAARKTKVKTEVTE